MNVLQITKVHITASVEKLLTTAEKMHLKKKCRDEDLQGMREFTKSRLKRGIFENSGSCSSVSY